MDEKKDPLPVIQDEVKPHTCPYKEEINNDFDTLCTCDDADMHECLMDI